MKTIGQLYEIVLSHLEKGEGICRAISISRRRGDITPTEEDLIDKHFMRQRPEKYSWWWWTSSYTGGLYWWPCDRIRPRKRFLKFLIKKYKNEYF